MAIYYRGPRARITNRVIEVWCPTYQSYAVGNLSQVWVVEQATDTPVNRVGVGSASVAGAVAVMLALGWTTGWDAFQPAAIRLITLALLVTSAVATAACWRAPAVEYKLVAIHSEREVVLYRDPDPHRFGQVRRGLTRAFEAAEDTG